MATLATDTFVGRTVSSGLGTGSDSQVWSPDSSLSNTLRFSVGSGEGNAVGTSYANTILADAPQAYYRFDESSGITAFDSSGNGYNGTYNSTGVTLSQTGAISGDTAALFDGVSGEMTSPSGLNPSGWAGFTVECWVKFASISSSAVMRIAANAGNAANKGFTLWLGKSAVNLNFAIGNGTAEATAVGTPTITTGVWYHIVGTWDGSTVTLYLNGVSIATASLTGTIAVATNSIGWAFNSPSTNNYLNATLDEGAIYATALSASRVLTHYNAGAGSVSYGIQLYGSTLTKDVDVRCRFSLYNAASSQFRVIVRYVSSTQYYAFRVDGSGGYLYVNNGSGETLLQSFSLPSISSITYYQGRFAFIGSQYYVKIWQDGTTEPASWSYSNQDASLSISGHYGLGFETNDTGTGQGINVDTFSVIDYFPTLPSSGTPGDRTIFKDQLCKVYSPSGVFIDVWRDVPLLSGFKETINAATSGLVVRLPRLFDDFDQANYPGSQGTVALGNIVQYWLYGPGIANTGLLRYQGYIDKIEPSLSAQTGQEMVEVTITPFSAVIALRGISNSVTFGTSGSPSTYVDPVSMFDYFFENNDPLTGLPYLQPLTLDPSNPSSSGVVTQYPFAQQTMDNVFQTILYMLPANFFYRVNPDKTTTRNFAATNPQHVLNLGQHLSDAKFSTDTTHLQNSVVLIGKSGTVSSVQTGSDVATFGQRMLFKSDTRLTDNSACTIIAQGLLTTYDVVLLRSPLRVMDYRGDNQVGLGYDIESIKVGDTVVIKDTSGLNRGTLWDSAMWDEAQWDFTSGAVFDIVTTIYELQYGFDYADITLGAPLPKISREVSKIAQQFADFTMGIQ